MQRIKDPAAVALGKKRALTLDRATRSAGGHARAASLTPERIAEISRMGVLAKAKKRLKKEKSLRRKSNGGNGLQPNPVS